MTDHASPGSEPLAGIRVLDLTTFLAGPLLTRQLADLGALVIKVEPPAGDPTRPAPGRPYPALWLHVHRGRRSVVIDLKAPAGRDLLIELAGTVDIVAENYRPGVAERLGIDAATLCAHHPRLVHVSITGYGSDGPMGDQVAIDGAVQAFAGSLELAERNGLPALPSPVAIADIAGAGVGTNAVLAALFARERSGHGCRIDVSLAEAVLPWIVVNRQASVAPPITQVVAARDGRRLLVQAPLHFHGRLLEVIAAVPGCEAALTDDRFADRERARANTDAYTALVQRAIAAADRDEWLRRLAEAGIPAAPVHDVDEALAHPQLAHRGAVADVVGADGTTSRIPLSPYRFDGARRDAIEHPPELGADTSAVLADLLGLDPDAVDRLARDGAFGAR